MSLTVLICSVIAIACAAYGTYAFSNNYTCRIAPAGKLKNICTKVAWIPSACVFTIVLTLTVLRTAPT